MLSFSSSLICSPCFIFKYFAQGPFQFQLTFQAPLYHHCSLCHPYIAQANVNIIIVNQGHPTSRVSPKQCIWCWSSRIKSHMCHVSYVICHMCVIGVRFRFPDRLSIGRGSKSCTNTNTRQGIGDAVTARNLYFWRQRVLELLETNVSESAFNQAFFQSPVCHQTKDWPV